MSKQVKGFLSSDGTFFEREPECKRHEAMQHLAVLCESHGTNFENLLILLNSWHETIKDYFNADNKCKEHQVIGKAEPQAGAFDDYDDDGDDLSALLPSKEHNPNPPIGSKDAPGFLEQQIRGNQRMPDVWDSPHAEAVPSARKSDGPRGRGSDASVLRGDAGVADAQDAKARGPRKGHRRPDIR